MPRRLPPFVYRERTRHGRWVTYFRRCKGARIRLPDAFGTPEFEKAYQAALTDNAPSATREQVSSQSLRWLVDRYRESAAWRQLAAATRKQRELIFLDAIERSGNAPFAVITRADIQRAVDKRADTPAYANNFLKSMRGLFLWAVCNEHISDDPTAAIDRIRYKTDGFPAWTMDDVEGFRDRHPIGEKARLAMELLLLTGLRRSDIIVAGQQHLRGDVFTIRTAKTGAVVTIRFPAWLLDLIAVSPTGDMHFIVSERGGPFANESFGNWFRDRCREAGINKSAHGLRKMSATLAANGGAAAHQLMAQYGWSKIEQAELYTRGADRARLGMEASEIVAGQIENETPRTPLPGAGKSKKPRAKSNT